MKSFGSDTVLFKHRFAQSGLVALVPCGQRDSFHQTALVPSATLHWGNKQKPRRLQPEEKKATETHSLSLMSSFSLQILTGPILKQVQGNGKNSRLLFI